MRILENYLLKKILNEYGEIIALVNFPKLINIRARSKLTLFQDDFFAELKMNIQKKKFLTELLKESLGVVKKFVAKLQQLS